MASDRLEKLLAIENERKAKLQVRHAAKTKSAASQARHERYLRAKERGDSWTKPAKERAAIIVQQEKATNSSDIVNLWKSDCWAFLTGKDADGRPMIWTKDEGDELNPFKPFPAHPYLREVLDKALFGPTKVVVMEKCRQMMMSTLSCLALYWLCLFHDGRKAFISKTKEDQAAMLMNDKIRSVHARTPEWFQREYPLSKHPQNAIHFKNTESLIYAVTENAAVGEFRGNTVSVALIDECAFQMKFPEMMKAAGPMASRIWAITTPNLGNPGAEVTYQLITEGTRD